MNAARANIIGLGASTPIGRNVWASAAAARAGVSGFSEHPFMVDTAGEPMRIAPAPWLDMSRQGAERYCDLLFPAMDEALGSLTHERARDGGRLGLALGLPPERPGRSADLARLLSRSITERYARVFVTSVTFEIGHAAGHLGSDVAVRTLQASSIDACLIAGVDSYLAPQTLEWIEACDQFHGAGPHNNAWGFIPGEAAGAILLASSAFAERVEAKVYGDLVSIGIAREDRLIKTDDVCIGEGLTRAFRAALEDVAPGEQIDNVFCDLNGETYRADEYGFAALRTRDRFRAATDFVAPADCWGDIGAAGGPLHTALAVICHLKRYGNGPLSMVWASSESGERGAALIRAADAAAGEPPCR